MSYSICYSGDVFTIQVNIDTRAWYKLYKFLQINLMISMSYSIFYSGEMFTMPSLRQLHLLVILSMQVAPSCLLHFDWLNEPRGMISRSCMFGFGISGVVSEFDHGRKDRQWRFLCSSMGQTTGHTCVWTCKLNMKTRQPVAHHMFSLQVCNPAWGRPHDTPVHGRIS